MQGQLAPSTIIGVVALLTALCASCGKEPAVRHETGARLNELCATNHTVRDDAGATGDWIELVNLGANPINLAGYYFSDDVDTRFIHVVSEAVTLPANGYLLFWADEKPEEG